MVEFNKQKRVMEIVKKYGVKELLRRYISYRFKWKYVTNHPWYIWVLCKRIQLMNKLNVGDYSSADPGKIIEVDPSEIQYEIKGYRNCWGCISNEDWQKIPIDQRERYNIFKQHFKEGVAWDKFDTDIDGEARDNLYNKIKNEGYKTQSELLSLADKLLIRPNDVEVGVGIDNHGQIVWTGWGRNRLFIAILCEVPKIPVQVRVRHKHWEQIRDNVKDRDQYPEIDSYLIQHPDLQDIIQ